ncbi:MAG: hypothetical protein IPJ84_14065 [Bdellovibrionales bacterium]|nr:hypothetical protein [Bdellovibrionales bacterium]
MSQFETPLYQFIERQEIIEVKRPVKAEPRLIGAAMVDFLKPTTVRQRVSKQVTRMMGRAYWPTAKPWGIRIFWLNRLRWERIESAELFEHSGLPYLKLKLNGRVWPAMMRTWGVPLYFLGVESFVKDVLENAPESNPLRRMFSEKLARPDA